MSIDNRNPIGENEGFDEVNRSTVRARQGFLGRPVLIVLAASLVLAVVAGVVIGIVPI